MKSRKKHLSIAVIIGIFLIGVDFFSKFLANKMIPYHTSLDSQIPFLKFYLTHNTGYHYIFGKIDNHLLWALFGLTVGAILIGSMIYSLLKDKLNNFYIKIYSIVLTLTIGAMGNVIEILFTGKATDFFLIRPFPWPTNVCDQYINAILYIILPIILIRHLYIWIKEKKLSNETN